MTPERFSALLDAYGGDPRRWPDAERDDARRFLQAHPGAEAARARATGLDAAIAAWTAPPAGAALAGRVLRQATARTARGRRVRLWWSGVVAAGALASGLAAGAIVADAASAPTGRDPLYGISVLGAPLPLETADASGPA